MIFANQIQFRAATKAILRNKLQSEPNYFEHWMLSPNMKIIA